MDSEKQIELVRPLNAADYFTLVMDEEIRKVGLAGSFGGIVLELSEPPDIPSLETRITEFVRAFPESTACLRKRGRRFYWCSPRPTTNIFFVHKDEADQPSDTFQGKCVEIVMNRSESREHLLPLEFHLIFGNETHFFLVRWLHPLCDAKGADLILSYLCETDTAKRQALGCDSAQLVDQHLKSWPWWKKALYFIKAKQYIKAIDTKNSILPSDDTDTPQRMSYKIFRFDREQTAVINRQVRNNVGLIGSTLYFIGCFMRAVDKAGVAVDGDAYCAPYAFNLRRQRAMSPIFGNQVSVLFTQAGKNLVADRKALFQHLKQQYQDAVRGKLDFAFLPTMWAGSWLSLEKYGQILRCNPKGRERSSFWFSDIGQIDLADSQFFGTDISGVFHVCQVTSPPSIALLVGQYNGQLTLSYSYIKPQISEDWLKQVQYRMEQELLGELG